VRVRVAVAFTLSVAGGLLIPIAALGAHPESPGSSSAGALTMTLVAVVIIGLSNSILITSIFGYAAAFPQIYMQAVMNGQGVAVCKQ